MEPTPFGDKPKTGRLHRALVYFGLKDEPPAQPGSSTPTPTETPSAPVAPGKRRTWQRQALVYFGLADDEESSSRYGTAISPTLDTDLEQLARRITALEDELRGCRAAKDTD